MRIDGLFLASRAGRRIFWTLLLAAAVPILLFGALTHGALMEHFDDQAHRQRMQATKFAGLGLLDNLVVARTVLGILARADNADVESRQGNKRGRVLAAVASVDAAGRVLTGDAALWARWRDVPIEWPADNGIDIARLVVGHDERPGDARQLLLALRVQGQADRFWIAEIDRDFLYSELRPEALGATICVLDGRGHPLFCPAAAPPAELLRVPAGTESSEYAAWHLFLRSDFGIDDWTLVQLDSGAPHGLASAPLLRMTALGSLATLLIVMGLSLVQVRRVTVPLQRLTAGTRRLSARDFGARVDHDSNDEFGELARSFNHMAERIGQQVEAMQVQAAIDGEILSGLDVSRVLQRVARRLAQLVPAAEIVVIELDRGSRMLARVHRAEGAFTVTSLTRAEMLCERLGAGDGLQRCEPVPERIAPLLREQATHAFVHCARAGSEPLALLVLGGGPREIDDEDVRREIGELSARVGVTLAAANRERLLFERAVHDSLTGLANRSGLFEHLERSVQGPTQRPFSVLFIDLDRFKEVNDTMGHEAGDELLRVVGQRLRACVPEDSLVARPGGDEFVVVVPGARDAADELVPRLLGQIGAPITLGSRTVSVGASIGLSRHPDDGTSASDLMRRADMAMYSAKGDGGGTAAWFDAALDVRLAERTALLADLRHALSRGQLELHYQGRWQVRMRRLRSCEALLRWRHPTRGLVEPAAFIDLLEDSGLIEPVGLWAIETACRQLARWRSEGLALDTVAVNVSTRQLHAPAFADTVLAIVRRCGLPPGALELEITESIFMGDSSHAISVLKALSAAGVHIALDDFGTGYSSLSYLHKLPIGILKVDRSFVAELGLRDSALALTRSIVALARALQLQVVAEGVETRQQADLLAGLGCDELQGYLFAKPLDAPAFAAFARGPAEAALVAVA